VALRPGVVVIKGSEPEVFPLKEAVKILIDFFCGSLAVRIVVIILLSWNLSILHKSQLPEHELNRICVIAAVDLKFVL
jgi:hypothetical protein